MKVLLAAMLLLVVAAFPASCQSECDITMNLHWARHDSNPTVYCEVAIAGDKRWWITSNPCSGSATELSQCGSDGSCVVPMEKLTASNCVVCCTDPTISTQFTVNSVGSCTTIKVCPVFTIMAPSIATTLTDVDIFTVVTTKPQPPPGSVSVRVLSGGSVPVVLRDVYPGTNSNNYTFVHTLMLSQAANITADFLQLGVDVSEVPAGLPCVGANSQSVRINLIRVNSSGSTPATRTGATLDPSGIETGDNNEGRVGLHPVSLAVGSGIGVGGMILLAVLIGIVFLVVRRARTPNAPAEKSSSSSHQFATSTGGSQPLLTINGTPAVTPSTDGQRSLGQSSSNTPASTPTASTPTDFHDLLPQQTRTGVNPYQEICLNGSARVPAGPVGSSPATVEDPPPLPQNPPPGYVPNPPRFTQVPMTSQYHTQGEAMKLSHQYNVGSSARV